MAEIEISVSPASPRSGQDSKGGCLMDHQPLAYVAWSPPGYEKTVVEATGSVIMAQDREGTAFNGVREANVSIGRARSRCGPEPQSEGPNPPVRVSSLVHRRITKPCVVPTESLSGILPSKELPCAYPRP